MIDTKAIRARAEAATKGPWGPYVEADREKMPEWGIYRAHVSPTTPELTCADATFIAAARSDVPALCDEVEQLRRLASDLARVLQRCCDNADFEGWRRGEFDHGREVAAEARAVLGDAK